MTIYFKMLVNESTKWAKKKMTKEGSTLKQCRTKVILKTAVCLAKKCQIVYYIGQNRVFPRKHYYQKIAKFTSEIKF